MASILLVDDDADLREFVESALEERGHQVTGLDSAERAPEILAKRRADLVLLDNKLPGMSGIEFLEILEQQRIDVPVILMTEGKALWIP